MTETTAPVSPSRHIDRIFELVDQALGIADAPPAPPVFFDLAGVPSTPRAEGASR